MGVQVDEAGKIASQPAATGFHASNAYRYYVVWLLFAVLVVNFVDRQILVILNEPLRAEFGLSDTQLGLLGGVAFAGLYSLLGVPIAGWADRSSRVNIISLAILIWSAFTALTAGAKVIWHLVVARIGVGIGEAGCSPPAYSLISDYFEPRRRATAMSIYVMGVNGGGFVGLLLGGLVAEQYGWRAAFLIAGAPGIVLALIVKLTLREPPRGYSDPPGTTRIEPPPARVVMRNLWAKQSFRWLCLAVGTHGLAMSGTSQFTASFLVRSHGLGMADLGQVLGVIVAVGGLSGTLLGGYLADRYANRHGDIRYYLFVPAVLLAINLPLPQLVYGTTNRSVALLTLIPVIALSASNIAPAFAITHRLVTVGERAVGTALFLLLTTLIGPALGPVVAGAISDGVRQMLMEGGTDLRTATSEGLRWSLRIVSMINVVAVWGYLQCARRIREEAV